MTVGALRAEGRGGALVGRWLADIDPDTGELLADENGQPVLILYRTAEEVAPLLGESPATVRKRCRAGEYECRTVGPRGTIYMSPRHVAAAIDAQQHRRRGEWDEAWDADNPGIRGLVVDPDEEGTR